MKNNTVVVIGLGYVGLPLASLAQRRGYDTVGIDIDQIKIDLINKRSSPLIATTDFSRIKKASIIIICVPTPVYENHLPNLEPVESVSRNIAKYIEKGQLIILESTVNPGVCEEVVLPLLEKSGLKGGRDFYLAHCPERINPGDKKWTVENIPRVIGSLEEKGLKKALSFYRSIIDAEIKPMGSIKEAEAVKIIENSFRDVNIAFVNELAKSFSHLDIDILNVIEGAATKPFAFMPHYPRCGVGGHCIPVDPYYLIEKAKQNGFNHDFLSLARKINNQMPEYTVSLVIESLIKKGVSPKKSKVTVLGIAYKPEINDTRESPSFEIIKILKNNGVQVNVYDPFVLEKSTNNSLDEAIEGSQAVVIATAHKAFRQLSPKYFLEKGVEIVVDGYNCLPKEKFLKSGIYYKGIGR